MTDARLLINLSYKLDRADPNDDKPFRAILVEAQEVLQLQDSTIARAFGTSLSTVKRWRNGTNAPHPAMIKAVYALFVKRMESMVRKITECA